MRADRPGPQPYPTLDGPHYRRGTVIPFRALVGWTCVIASALALVAVRVFGV